jgi:DNA-binding XRE family transcriptional regulator
MNIDDNRVWILPPHLNVSEQLQLLGQKLAEFRINAGLSQAELAALSGIDEETIVEIEFGTNEDLKVAVQQLQENGLGLMLVPEERLPAVQELMCDLLLNSLSTSCCN